MATSTIKTSPNIALWEGAKRFIVDVDESTDRVTFYINTHPTMNIGYRIWMTPAIGIFQKRFSENETWTTIKQIW